MLKNIVLCADDYGLNHAINQAILHLLAHQRLTAVSCMTTYPDWLKSAEQLKPYHYKIDMGLHFNLTEGAALSGTSSLTHPSGQFYSLNQLLSRAFLQRLKLSDIIQELNMQLDCFETAFNQLPDFIDGHQHIHHLPIIRDAFLIVYQERLLAKRPYVRSVYVSWLQTLKLMNIKIMIIQLTGAHSFKKILEQNNLPHNQFFSGFYNFNGEQDYSSLFKGFVLQLNHGGLMMCHPGESHAEDTIGAARQNELNYLSSPQFIADCKQLNIRLTTFQDIENPS